MTGSCYLEVLCTHDCGAVLRIDMDHNWGSGGRPEGLRTRRRYRQAYIGKAIEEALLAHVMFDCPNVDFTAPDPAHEPQRPAERHLWSVS